MKTASEWLRVIRPKGTSGAVSVGEKEIRAIQRDAAEAQRERISVYQTGVPDNLIHITLVTDAPREKKKP